MKLNVKKLTLVYSKSNFKPSDILLLLYITSVIIVSMIPVGNIISQLMGGLLLVYFLFFLVIPQKKQILLNSEFVLMIGFLLFGLVSGYFAKDMSLVATKIKTLVQLIILFIIGYSLIIQNNLKLKHFYFTIILSVLFILVFGMFSHITDPIITRDRLTSTAADPNFLAVLTAFAVLFTAGMITLQKSKFLKIILLLMLVVMLYGILQTQSRQGLLLAFFNIAMLVFMNNYKKISIKRFNFKLTSLISLFLIVAVVVGVIIYLYNNTNYFLRIQLLASYIKLSLSSSNANNIILTADTSVFERKQLIINGIKMWFDHPFFGVGLDNYRITIREYWPISRKLYAHNNYVELASTVGTFGLAAFYLIYWSIFRKLMHIRQYIKDNEQQLKNLNILIVTFFGLLFIEIFTVTYYVKFVWIFLFIMIGIADRIIKNGINKELI